VTGVASGRQYLAGGVPAAGCTTTDGLSGVATSASAYSVVHRLGRFLVPASGATLANSARTIPVKYRLADSAGQPIPRASGRVASSNASGRPR
jgi:hypothetical protein